MPDLLKVYSTDPGRQGQMANMFFAANGLGLCAEVERNATLALAQDFLTVDIWNLPAARRMHRRAVRAAMSDLLRSLHCAVARSLVVAGPGATRTW